MIILKNKTIFKKIFSVVVAVVSPGQIGSLNYLEIEMKKLSSGAKWGQNGPNGAKWDQTGPNMAKRGQTGPNGAKRGQTGLNGANEVI